MKNILANAFKQATTLDQVRDEFILISNNLKQERRNNQLGYVAGIINSDGPEKLQENIKKLIEQTEIIRKNNNFPIFSATDIFYQGLYQRLSNTNRALFIKFWREILEKASVTDIFMTPRWNMSEGAKDEHETAKRLGLKIHYVE